MANGKPSWSDPWRDAFIAESRVIREADDTKDAEKRLAAMRERLPNMVAIRSEFGSMALPYAPRPGLGGIIKNLISGLKPEDLMEAQRQGVLKFFDESIHRSERELRKLESRRR